MKFATLKDGSLDGRLVLVSRDGRRALAVPQIAASLLDALQRWPVVVGLLQERSDALNRGQAQDAFAFDASACAAPLPRCPQWLDGSAFLNHGRLMEQAFNTPPIPHFDTVPVMYQGASDDFLGPHDDVPLPDEADGIDFEGEFGVVCGPVPMAASPAAALERVRLVVQLNDWSLRALGPHEMKTGFGFLQAKPSTAFAPVAVTPDELGDAWRDGRVGMRLHVQWNGERFGEPDGGEMNFSFGGHDRRLGHGVQPVARGGLGLHRRAPRDREDRPRRDPHRLHALRRPCAHAGALRRRRGRAVRRDRAAGRPGAVVHRGVFP
jgi:fumarylacetoacetate (FAA) hydrolase